MVKFCDIGLIKSLLAAKLLWGRELKVDAASAYRVILKTIHCPSSLLQRETILIQFVGIALLLE